MRRGSCRKLSSGPLVSLWEMCLCVLVCVGGFARQASWRGSGCLRCLRLCVHFLLTVVYLTLSLCPHDFLFICSKSQSLTLISLSVSISIFVSFRFICQHSTNIPKVRGHALHHGQDPCPWDSPNSALNRLWVIYSHISNSMHRILNVKTEHNSLMCLSFTEQWFVNKCVGTWLLVRI